MGIALAVGCVGSAPPRLYTLNMTPSGSAKATVNIDVARLRPLDALSGSDIVIRRGEHEVDTYPLDHWASNLGELVARKLEAEFGDSDPSRPTIELTGEILSFEQVLSGEVSQVRVALALEARKKGDSRYTGPLFARTYRAELPITGAATPTKAVAALSQAVEAIARDIAGDLNTLDLSAGRPAAKHERLHTLDMTPSGKATAPMNIDVTVLRRHEALARNNILIRPNPTTVEYFPEDRWAASVSSLVSEKLESEFGAPVAGRETLQLSGNVLAFERLDTPNGVLGHAKIDATLSGGGQPGQARPLLWKIYEASSPADGNSAASVAKALSRALAEIAAAIVVDVGRVPPPQPTPGAPPVRLYSLDMKPSGNVACKYNVMFDRIQPHDSLTRADILILRDETLVDRFPNDRWASGLAELVPEKLAAEFGHPDDTRKTINIGGMINGFEQTESGGKRAALVKLDLVFRWADTVSEKPALRRIYEADVPIEGDGALGAVHALSRALEKIAVQVASDINALNPPTAN